MEVIPSKVDVIVINHRSLCSSLPRAYLHDVRLLVLLAGTKADEMDRMAQNALRSHQYEIRYEVMTSAIAYL